MRPLSTTASPSNLGLAVVCTWRPIRFKNELRATSYELRATSYEPRLASYENYFAQYLH